jgi:hypothetical protein
VIKYNSDQIKARADRPEAQSQGAEWERTPDETCDKAEREAADAAAAAEEKRRDTQAQQLSKIAEGTGLFHAPDGTGYADILIGDHRETYPIRSKAFRSWVLREYYEQIAASLAAMPYSRRSASLRPGLTSTAPNARFTFALPATTANSISIWQTKIGALSRLMTRAGAKLASHQSGFVAHRECCRCLSPLVAAASKICANSST